MVLLGFINGFVFGINEKFVVFFGFCVVNLVNNSKMNILNSKVFLFWLFVNLLLLVNILNYMFFIFCFMSNLV